MSTVQVNGIELYYEEHGDTNAEPVLLIMGFMTNAGAWAPQIAALAPRYRVVAFDNRGCGRSSQPEGPYTIALLADDAASLLDHLAIESAHIVGASMGGMIAQEFALRYARRVRSLSLLCTTAGGPRSFGYEEMVNASSALDEAEDFASLNTPERMQQAMLTMFTPEFLQKPNEAFQQTTITALQYPPSITGARAQQAAILAHDTLDRLPRITAPTLVTTGEDDGLLDARNSELLAERIPGAELVIFPKLRHGFNIEDPDAVNETLLTFLAKHSAVGVA